MNAEQPIDEAAGAVPGRPADEGVAQPVSVAFRTLGCKVNRVESEDAAAALVGSGAVLAAEDDAQVVVVNTCTVTGEADAKARKAVRQALAAKSEPVVVVTGCLAALDVDGLRALGDRVVVEPDKEAIASVVADLLGMQLAEGAGPRAGAGFRTRAMLKVQDGCDNFCAYCIVPHARGVPRSVPRGTVLAEARGLLSSGVAELVLTGINIGRYDSEGLGLAGLVTALSALGPWRIRISSIEPPDLDDELISALTEAGVRHVHLPLQSGSDAVLRAMGRRYDVADYTARVARFRQAGGLSVSTDVMVGFPGETEADFQATLRLVEQLGLERLHVFRYSPRAGTPAAELVQAPAPTKAMRAQRLRELGGALMARHLAARIGDSERVLVEQVDQDGNASATTIDYAKVDFPSQGAVAGELVTVAFNASEGSRLLAYRVAAQGESDAAPVVEST